MRETHSPHRLAHADPSCSTVQVALDAPQFIIASPPLRRAPSRFPSLPAPFPAGPWGPTPTSPIVCGGVPRLGGVSERARGCVQDALAVSWVEPAVELGWVATLEVTQGQI